MKSNDREYICLRQKGIEDIDINYEKDGRIDLSKNPELIDHLEHEFGIKKKIYKVPEELRGMINFDPTPIKCFSDSNKK